VDRHWFLFKNIKSSALLGGAFFVENKHLYYIPLRWNSVFLNAELNIKILIVLI